LPVNAIGFFLPAVLSAGLVFAAAAWWFVTRPFPNRRIPLPIDFVTPQVLPGLLVLLGCCCVFWFCVGFFLVF
jgi:hypothetical protein